MKRIVLLLLLSTLLHLSVAGAQAPTPALPQEARVRQVLEALPQVQAARALLRSEEANSRRLVAGNYEWTARAVGQQRRETLTNQHLPEEEIALERAFRLPGKADKDARLGEAGVHLAEARVADTWHEAARALLRAWFDYQREQAQARRLQDHVRVLEQQLAIVDKRVAAGDAPRLEQMLAGTELQRGQAQAAQAAARAERAALDLQKRYPGLLAQPLVPLPAPALLPGSVADWSQLILRHNHEIELAELDAAQNRLQAERILLDRKPDPTVGFRYSRERDGQERVLGVSLSMPLPGAARAAQADAALSRSDAAAQKAREVRMRVENDASQVALQARSTWELSSRFADLARQAEASAALMVKAYSLGEAGLNDSLLARRQALEALGAAEQAQLDALEAHARLLLDMHRIWSLEGHDEDQGTAPRPPVQGTSQGHSR